MMDHVELYRKVRNGDYREMISLDEFELVRFVGYLIQRLREMETERITENVRRVRGHE